jgi:hypothetical protein
MTCQSLSAPSLRALRSTPTPTLMSSVRAARESSLQSLPALSLRTCHRYQRTAMEGGDEQAGEIIASMYALIDFLTLPRRLRHWQSARQENQDDSHQGRVVRFIHADTSSDDDAAYRKVKSNVKREAGSSESEDTTTLLKRTVRGAGSPFPGVLYRLATTPKPMRIHQLIVIVLLL